MRVLVIGEPCIDVIHKADGKVYHEQGGISYSVTASGMLDDSIETIPVIGLSRTDRGYFESLFARLDGINPAGIYEVASPARRVDLFYEDENSRWECSTQPVEPTPFDKIQPFLPADGILLNLISGSDITLDTLGRIRTAAPNAHIHLDLHNMVMQHLADGKRVRGRRTDYLEWCSYADSVQLNEDEAKVIDSPGTGNDALAEKILACGAEAVVISFAERGLALYQRSDGKTIKHFFPAKPANVVDPTGSGDVFGAAFLHALLLGKTHAEAAEAGIAMAVKKVGAAGPGGLLKNKKVDTNA